MLNEEKVLKYQFDISCENDGYLAECLNNIEEHGYAVKLISRNNNINDCMVIEVAIKESQLEDFSEFAEMFLNEDFKAIQSDLLVKN